MIEVNVRLFAITRDLAGASSVTLAVPHGATISLLLDELGRRFPPLLAWKAYLRVAVNCRYVPGDQVVTAGDDIAIIPPVSGG
jgi:molybdopterin converting factor subunit 1